MFATSGVGMEWGQRWLNEVLAGSCSGCAIDTLEVLPACPESDPDRFFRTLYGAGLTEGPVFTSGEDADFVQEVAFTLSVAEPYLFAPAVTCLDEVSVGPAGSECCEVSTNDWNGDAALIITLEAGDSGAQDITVEMTPSYTQHALLLDGTGDRATTPDDPALDIVGDITLWGVIDPVDWTPATSSRHIIGKDDTVTNRSYGLRLATTGALEFLWSTDGFTMQSKVSGVLPGVVVGTPLCVKMTFDVSDAGNNVARFYYKAYVQGVPAKDQGEDTTGWTLLTTDTDAGATTIFSGTAAGSVGARTAPGVGFEGRILAAGIQDGIDGTPVANPDFSQQPVGTTTFTDDAGRTWTLQSDAAIVAGDCPGDAPPCAVYRIPVLNPDDRLVIDAVRNQVVLHDPTRKTEVAGLQLIETDGLFDFPTVGPCSTVCVCVSNDGATPVTATVTSSEREV